MADRHETGLLNTILLDREFSKTRITERVATVTRAQGRRGSLMRPYRTEPRTGLFVLARLLPLLLLVHGNPALAALGDNAPPIPASYVTAHPRLGAPTNSWLLSLWNGGSLPARYANAAGTASTGFDQACIRQNCSGTSFRYLLLSYMASKAAGVPNSVWKSKLMAMASLGGTWGPVMLSDDTATADSSACTTNCTITDTAVNFLTGCGGGSCNGNYLTVLGLRYVIQSVPDSSHVVIHKFSTGLPYPFPNGTGVKIRILGNLYDTGETTYYHAMLYDWLYSDLTAQQQSDMQTSLANLCLQFENDYVASRYSPYNDLLYSGQNGWSGKLGMFAAAIAIYPDMGATGLQHVRWATDVLLNVILPAWKHVMSTGGWHESWNDYIESNANVTLKAYIVGALLPWANASGNMPGLFTVDNPWLKNFAYLTMYVSKPDFTMEKLGAVSNANFSGEYQLCSIGASMGALNGLAEIYNDPVLRGWARLVNEECSGGPDGMEPSAWPYYTPDNNSNASSDRSSLPLCHNFTGWGTIVCRSGWSEDDTWMTFRYGDDFWSHQHFDSGSFTLFNRGSLAIDSGVYHAGSYGRHYVKYASQTIAHNTLVIKDPADNYPSELSQAMSSTSASIICEAVSNDGGQRRVGSGWQSYFTTGTCGGPVTNVAINSPDNLAMWLRAFPYYHYGTLSAYAASPSETAPQYVYMVADLTNAYNNGLNPSLSNRTQRVAKFLRHMVFIPRGHAGYLVVYDQITSTNATFVKKWLLHSINQPVITGSKYVIQRTENVTSKPYSGIWPGGFMAKVLAYSPDRVHYQYAGQLTGFAVSSPNYGGAPSLSAVGGPGHEFDDGTGTNQNECQYSIQCADAGDPWGLGDTNAGCPLGFICPTSATGGQEAGAWRIEEQPYASGSSAQDWFLNVMLASTAGDTNVPVSVTAPTGLAPGMAGATWADANNTYTITFPQSGVGGHITITGVVDEDLLSHAQPLPGQLQVFSGDAQSGSAGNPLPNPLVAIAKDSAGNPVPNATVYFAVTQGSGQLSSAWATTNSLGLASVSLTQGTGSVTTVMAYVNGLTPVSFNASVAGGSGTSTTVNAVSCAPTSLSSGTTSTCTVTLSQAAGTSGATVMLSSNTQALTVPTSVLVLAGSSAATFTAAAGSVSSAQTAVVTAALNGSSQTASLSLLSSTAITLNSVSCSLTSLSVGATSTCTVALSQAAGPGGVSVTLSSNTLLVEIGRA